MFNRMDWELAEMKRGERATLGAPNRELSKKDRAFIQQFMNDFYDVFIDRVAQTRKIPAETVRKIAEGRIWTGRDAVENGLVDEIGGLADAIEAARAMANIPPSAELKIVHYPRPSSLGEFFESFSGVSMSRAIETFTRVTGPARPLTFDQQVTIFSQRIEPLCWMAVPEFWNAQWQSPVRAGVAAWPPGGDRAAQPITTNPPEPMLGTWPILDGQR